jgi:hypothetical protein
LPRPDLASAGLVACCIAGALLVGWISVAVNLERACALEESIAAAFCPSPAPGSAAQSEMLVARIAREPGDSNALTALALNDRSPQRERFIALAGELAPREPNVLLLKGAAALDRRDWAAAAPPLVELLENRDIPLAALALLWLVQNGLADVLEPHVRPQSRWLTRLLGEIRRTETPLGAALPLITQAMRVDGIDADTVRAYVRELKSRGLWADAYALWLSMHGGKGPLLFNASFDHVFEADGFDWEAPASASARRAGARVDRRPTEQRGSVLEVQLTGRPIEVPVVRQYLFIAPGRYRLHGDFLARQLRMEDGMVWVLQCAGGEAARSRAFKGDSPWGPFDFEFTVPANCGLVASLQLQPATASDAALGTRGRVAFDAFTIDRTGS